MLPAQQNEIVQTPWRHRQTNVEHDAHGTIDAAARTLETRILDHAGPMLDE